MSKGGMDTGVTLLLGIIIVIFVAGVLVGGMAAKGIDDGQDQEIIRALREELSEYREMPTAHIDKEWNVVSLTIWVNMTETIEVPVGNITALADIETDESYLMVKI